MSKVRLRQQPSPVFKFSKFFLGGTSVAEDIITHIYGSKGHTIRGNSLAILGRNFGWATSFAKTCQVYKLNKHRWYRGVDKVRTAPYPKPWRSIMQRAPSISLPSLRDVAGRTSRSSCIVVHLAVGVLKCLCPSKWLTDSAFTRTVCQCLSGVQWLYNLFMSTFPKVWIFKGLPCWRISMRRRLIATFFKI